MLSRLSFATACKAAKGIAAELLVNFWVPAARGKDGAKELNICYLSESNGSQTSTNPEFEFYDFTEFSTLLIKKHL